MRGKRVVVLGGAGFIGSHLCETLLAQDAQVVSVDNLITGNLNNIAPFWVNVATGIALILAAGLNVFTKRISKRGQGARPADGASMRVGSQAS